MNILWGITALLLAVTTAHASSAAEEMPARAVHPIPPDYPAACLPEAGELAKREIVSVTYGVTRDGQAENVRVRETTNPCFDEVAIAAVRSWKFEPRRVKNRPQAQEDLETTFIFAFEEATQSEDFDARPMYREPPRYPEICMRGAANHESVLIEFDVTAEGETENIRVIESTRTCFENAAKRAVKKWRYRPKTLSGIPVVRKGVQTIIRFNLSDDGAPEWKIRHVVAMRLEKVRRLIVRGADPQDILSKLEEIEAEYGDSFSRAELAAFHQFRGAARIEAGDYKGALDDLRIAQRMGVAGDATEAIGKTIIQLEAAIAAQEAAAAQADDGGEQVEDEDLAPTD